MRTEKEVVESAIDRPAFSNGTEYYEWSGRWCERCHTPAEKAWRDYDDGKRKQPHKDYPSGCPLIACVIAHGKTPIEFLEQPDEAHDRYQCIEFRGPDDGDYEPKPLPDPPGMDGLFARPARSVRMLTQLGEQFAHN